MPSSDRLFGTQLSAFKGNFRPWNCPEPLFALPNQDPAFSPKKPQDPVFSPEKPQDLAVLTGSYEPDPNRNNSNSDEPNRSSCRVNYTVDKRKRRKNLLYRESARRSRYRKRRHLENLTSHVNQLRVESRELMNQIQLVKHHCDLMRRENDQLQSESAMLQKKLGSMNQQNPPS